MNSSIKNSAGNFSITIRCSLEDLDIFRRSFTDFLKCHGVQNISISHLELSTYEIIANTIEHGTVCDSDSLIDFKATLYSKKLVCSIEYPGPEFDPTKAEDIDIVSHFRSGASRGLGIYIVNKLMDGVSYKSEGGINKITITKNLTF